MYNRNLGCSVSTLAASLHRTGQGASSPKNWSNGTSSCLPQHANLGMMNSQTVRTLPWEVAAGSFLGGILLLQGHFQPPVPPPEALGCGEDGPSFSKNSWQAAVWRPWLPLRLLATEVERKSP